MFNNRILPVLFFIAIILLISGCNSKDITKKNERPTIGLLYHDQIDERWQRDRDLFEKHADELGADVLTLSAGGDENKQISQAEELLKQDIDVLVIVAQNAENLQSVIDKAHKQGVKVISYARLIKNADVDFYVSIDNVKAGEMQAQEILSRAPKGNYVYIGGGDTDNNAVLLRDGSMHVLKQEKQIHIVADEYSKDWNPKEALKHMNKALADTNGIIQGIVAANDGTAGAAIEALKKYGLAGKVPISGQDAELEALQRIVEGTQAMTIYLPIENMVNTTVEAAIQYANHKKPVANQTVSNGQKDVPSNLLTPVTVTKENIVSTIVEPGYALMEDIYKNIPKDQWPHTK
ncbi:sugar ABC transporter substrate-binding protein [Ferdinandcohnia quinoae]|uniref:Substrate-binding domain-containing protein n=1 Tax=Fredinandcohnia quinoae TaxID=2918902 RepID=A0AAW5E9V5_9BACI|nr:substrate-binding domain-containing protein [Fredinandcohnia sp. SECRCQ15]MCH1627784.1 substrate-binding domain-containing protein [Fredinandcohnia sp. SECRCQ15]